MKKIILFVAAGLLMMTTAQAIERTNDGPIKGYSKRYQKVQPVLFTYENVDYAIYPDGHLEFEVPRYVTNAHYSRRATDNRRGSYARQNLQYNRYGQVTFINGTRVFYNRNGQVARLGALDVDYHRGILDRVGGLDVRYNRNGKLIAARGHVNIYADLGYRHDCSSHNFGHVDVHGYAQNDRDWDEGVYFKRGKKSK
ncbi:hypothetical protein [Nonlabens marinus]|uniref:Uncharacterized protein n=1 Tax=Nonlabens marinus S1-08 TaxID=1454201 RepID=W8VVS2_9FLAO|nr:hypothetical protein [Nonlabens marinus]BAO55688.1 hypothetical protein NMS_1679 [Nonlabens marinus S1-08]